MIGISSGQISAEIDPHGAQLSSLKDYAGRELLWNGDPAMWAGRAPLLFPIVGALAGGNYRVNGRTYVLPRHGFARVKDFSVESAEGPRAIFKLSADASTLQVYPFHFELRVVFEVVAQTLSVVTTVRNLCAEDMPASFGYHPAFRWPTPFGAQRSSHFIEFDADEPAPMRRLDAAGLLSPTLHASPIVARKLTPTDALFLDDVIIFDRVASRGVSYGADQGPRLRIEFPDSPFLGIWSKPGAGFLCIEPWHGIADPQGFTGEFKDKPGVFILASGAELSATMTVSLSRQGQHPAWTPSESPARGDYSTRSR